MQILAQKLCKASSSARYVKVGDSDDEDLESENLVKSSAIIKSNLAEVLERSNACRDQVTQLRLI